MNKTLQFLVRTASMVAITVALQAAFLAMVPPALGLVSTIAVGSAVYLGLFVATRTTGLLGGSLTGIMTPLVAALTGKAQWIMTPFIIVANIILCVLFTVTYKVLFRNISRRNIPAFTIAVVVSTAVKVAFLMLVAYAIAPLLVSSGALKTPMMLALQINFSYPQVIAAAIGSVLAYFVCFALGYAKLVPKEFHLVFGSSLKKEQSAGSSAVASPIDSLKQTADISTLPDRAQADGKDSDPADKKDV